MVFTTYNFSALSYAVVCFDDGVDQASSIFLQFRILNNSFCHSSHKLVYLGGRKITFHIYEINSY